MIRWKLLAAVVAAAVSGPLQAKEATVAHLPSSATTLEEVKVWGNGVEQSTAPFSGPTSLLSQHDLGAINMTTTEDAVKFEPGVIVRRRFIGDANGVLGMRSSHMMQNARTMVFADGVPLHYFLQSRWHGAPRWTLVSADEIAQVEVIYGPFSALYSGNAMGGVINIETAIPERRTFSFDSAYFSQSFDAYGFDDRLDGYKSFVAFGDKLGKLSYYLSYNRLENKAQPQSFYYAGDGSLELDNATGSIVRRDTTGKLVHLHSDSGVEEATTNNYKMKLGYEIGAWQALLNLAYEDRARLQDSANTYLRNASGEPIWSGVIEQSDGSSFNLPAARLGVITLDRESLNAGLRVRGPLADNLEFEGNFSRFEVLRDNQRTSAFNPQDPAFTAGGEVQDFGDTGWDTADLSLTFDNFVLDGMTLTTGLRRESYKLNLAVYDSEAYRAAEPNALTSASGGETRVDAAFAQFNWTINSFWDLGIGLRYENWQADNGYYSDQDALDGLALVAVPGRELAKTSPKLALGYHGFAGWTLRYSLAKAHRFPIVEELYSQYSAFNSASIPNPNLRPEDGLHQNFMIDREVDGGYLRVNLFHDRINDQIESFTDLNTGLRTFHSMAEVAATGLEFIANLEGIAQALDIRFNVTHMLNAEVVSNPGDPRLEGKGTTQMPKWRGKLLATYRIGRQWDASLNLQYSSKAWSTLENSEVQWGVFGAQDAYARVGLKTDYRFANGITLGLGVDNLTNEVTYVYHPWPGRTFYANFGYRY